MSDGIFIPIHQWTHDGNRVLLVKCVAKGGKSCNDFQWPTSGTVSTPNWSPTADCASGGLFGWPWGLNLGGGKPPEYRGDWIVFAAEPESVIEVDCEKSKAGPSAEVLYYGDWQGALEFTRAGRETWLAQRFDAALAVAAQSFETQASEPSGAASATGESGASSATGWSGAASATGERGAASATGESGAASATGERGAASATGGSGAASATGERGAASATGGSGAASATGERGAASATGDYSTIEVGSEAAGVATCDEFTWIAHPGAVLLHRWLDGHAIFLGNDHPDGARVHIFKGHVVSTDRIARTNQ